MKTKVTVMYVSSKDIDKKLDAAITEAMINGGFDWYAQGYDLRTKERDLCFEVETDE